MTSEKLGMELRKSAGGTESYRSEQEKAIEEWENEGGALEHERFW